MSVRLKLLSCGRRADEIRSERAEAADDVRRTESLCVNHDSRQTEKVNCSRSILDSERVVEHHEEGWKGR